ncbi:MAG TPA: 4-vinyl reductase [Longilinea sp.]|nr:4-vinyl reductase [Longilinea sp.]
MQPIPQSGLYYPNKFGRILIQMLESILGRNGVNSILNLANLPDRMDNLPPDDFERQFDFAELSSIIAALEEIYGVRGGRGLAMRAGNAAFTGALRDYGTLAGISNPMFKNLPLQVKLRVGLPAIARIISQLSDQISTVEEKDDQMIFSIQTCPACHGRSSESPACSFIQGLLQEGLKWVSDGGEFRVFESQCIAMGDPACVFFIDKEPIG